MYGLLEFRQRLETNPVVSNVNSSEGKQAVGQSLNCQDSFQSPEFMQFNNLAS